MARHTTLKVGGGADLLFFPADLDDLQAALVQLREARIPYLVLGGGSNLLVKDGGIRGCVISLKMFRGIHVLPNARIEVAGGARSAAVSRFAAKFGLTGIEFLCAIPGTIGGAIAVNAGAYGRNIVGKIETLLTVDPAGLRMRGRHELEYAYRYLYLDPEEVVVSAVLELHPGDPTDIMAQMADYLTHRGESQQVGYPNAGSFFKNPAGHAAWKLIDQAGLRGYTVGGAQVSEVHTNFLVNRGDATAADLLELARVIKEKVKAESGIELEEEVRIVGEDA
ncbi:UDP-N-acetylmuramate dehydrogenase [Geomonas sp. Red875]|uniref:UDP-N-acetylenolpyruvoylglucosamine reductase n=2 Tax=Geomesophilobacter sediminis TaxID=2798584 RepID=A0A8J7S9B3_9BACT|nr:UDP-N-acetylmuramate dehydrogenase [Geomesophilobacter sediminis]